MSIAWDEGLVGAVTKVDTDFPWQRRVAVNQATLDRFGVEMSLPEAPPAAPRASRRFGARHWSAAVGFSVFVHTAFAGVLLAEWRSSASLASPPPAAMVVEIAMLPSAPPVPPSQVPPGPEQVEAAPKPVPMTEEIKFDPLPEADARLKPRMAIPKKEKPKPKPVEEVVEAKAAPQTTAPVDMPAPVEDTSAAPVAGSTQAPPSDAELAWEGKILAKLERNKRYPREAQRAGHEDIVYVRIVLDRNGKLISANLAKSQGFALLDAEVMELAERASPYPAPPETVAGDQIALVVPVEFFIKRR